MSNFNNIPTGWLSDSTANKYIKTYFKGNVDINEGDLVVRGKNKINVWNHEIKADFIDVLTLPPTSTGLTLVYPSLSVTYSATSQLNNFQNGNYTISSTGNYNDSTTGINKLFDKDINTAYSSPLNSYNINTGISQFNNYTNTTYQGEYFQIQFPYQFYLTSYQLRPISPFTQFPTLFYLFGSTNGTTWTLIDTENQTTPTNNNLITYTLTAS
jgi:hypothetical protein